MLLRWDVDRERWHGTRLEQGQRIGFESAAFVVDRGIQRYWLLAKEGQGVTVNGFPPLPLRLLADRDELRIDGEMMYVTTQAPPEVVAYREDGQGIHCGRCKGALEAGNAAVCCPRCGAWHHQTGTLSCWSYDARCSGCEQRTEEASWQPARPHIEKG